MNNEKNWRRRQFLKCVANTGLAGIVMGLNSFSCTKKQRRPNILLIVTDDQGINDVSAYGSEIPTPNIDEIGQNGIRFTNFYVTAPVCTPSRYGLLTGRYQYRSIEAFQEALLPRDPKHEEVHLSADEITIADVLKRNGYKTALIGKWHLGHGDVEFGPNNHGFDYFYGFLPGCIDYYRHTYESDPAWYRNKTLIEEEGYATDLLTNEAIRFIEEHKDVPFFLDLSYNAPHYGRCPDGKLLQSPPEAKELPEKSVADRAVYAAMVKNLDKGIGRVIETLRRLQLEEDTIVIFCSDNGGDYDYGGNNKPYRGEKGTLWEGGIRVPCHIQWKGHIQPDQTSDQPIISLDFFPTLIRLTGVAFTERILDGYDISDVLLTNKPAPDRYLFFRRKNQIAVRDKRWKYLKDSDDKEYLFDLTNDPYEQHNLLDESPEQAHLLKTEFEEFFQNL